MRFFSKITFIFNCCFVAFVILREVESGRNVKGSHDAVIPLPVVQNSLVVLGVIAIIVSFIFAVCILVFRLVKKQHNIARWLVWTNLLFLLLQVVYFKLY